MIHQHPTIPIQLRILMHRQVLPMFIHHIWFIIIRLRQQTPILHRSNMKMPQQLFNQHLAYQRQWTSMFRWISILIIFNIRMVTMCQQYQQHRIRISRTNHFIVRIVIRFHRQPIIIIIHRTWKLVRILCRVNKRWSCRLHRMITKIYRNYVISFRHRRRQLTRMKNESMSFKQKEYKPFSCRFLLFLVRGYKVHRQRNHRCLNQTKVVSIVVVSAVKYMPDRVLWKLIYVHIRVKKYAHFCFCFLFKKTDFLLFSHTNVINVRKHLLKLPISQLIYEHIRVKNHFHVMFAVENSLKVHRLQHICEHIRVNDHINVNIVEKPSQIVRH